MFALAIWDREEKSLFLARDRLGKKPLYVWRSGRALAFASEIKALLEVPGVERRLRPDAVKDYFTYQYVPDPKSIFENIEKLAPGHWMRVDADGGVTTVRWWDVSFATTRTGRRRRDRRGASRADRRQRAHPHDQRRAARRLPERRGGFERGRRPDGEANSEAPVTTCAVGFESEAHDETPHAAPSPVCSGPITASSRSAETSRRAWSRSPPSSTSRSPTPRSCRPTSSRGWPVRRSRSPSPGTAATRASPATRSTPCTSARAALARAAARTPLRSGRARACSRGACPGTSIRRCSAAANLLRSLGASAADGFFICNSFFREDRLECRLATGPNSLGKRATTTWPRTRARHYEAADTDDDARARALHRPEDLPAGRHPGQGRSDEHGQLARVPGAAARLPRHRVRRLPAVG